MPRAIPAPSPARTARAPLSAQLAAGARAARLPLLVGLAVLVACLAGIAMRPAGFLSCFWPANALLVGLLVRLRATRRPAVWAWAFAGYVAADLLNGSNWALAIWLTLANLTGVLAATLMLRKLDPPTRQLRRQRSVLHLLWICFLASGLAALAGGGSGPLLFSTPWLHSLAMWFSSELLNYLLILPVILATPRRRRLGTVFTAWHPETPVWKQVGPLAAVLAVQVLTPALGGVSWAVALVVPALLWCAISYSLFVTSLLCLAVCLWKTVELAAAGALAFQPDQWQVILWLRVGIAMLSLGPLGVAGARAARDDMVRRLSRSAPNRAGGGPDEFLARSVFAQRVRHWLAQPLPQGSHRPAGLLVLAIDPLPQIVSEHGHAAGERVLAAVVQALSLTHMGGEPLARRPGDKLALLLPGASDSEAMAIAERLCSATRMVSIAPSQGLPPIPLTVSIGAAFYAHVEVQRSGARDALIRAMLGDADRLLAQAQAAGRDCVVFRALGPPGSLADADWPTAACPT